MLIFNAEIVILRDPETKMSKQTNLHENVPKKLQTPSPKCTEQNDRMIDISIVRLKIQLLFNIRLLFDSALHGPVWDLKTRHEQLASEGQWIESAHG